MHGCELVFCPTKNFDAAAFACDPANRINGVLLALGAANQAFQTCRNLRREGFNGAIAVQSRDTNPDALLIKQAKAVGALGLFSKKYLEANTPQSALVALRDAISTQRTAGPAVS